MEELRVQGQLPFVPTGPAGPPLVGDCCETRVGIFECRTRAQTPHHLHDRRILGPTELRAPDVSVLPEVVRGLPEGDLVASESRQIQAEVGGQDAYDLVGMAVEANRRTEHGRVSAEVVLPESVVQDDGPHGIVGTVGPTEDGVHAQELEEAARAPSHAHLTREPRAGEVLVDEGDAFHVVEGRYRPEIGEVAPREMRPRHLLHLHVGLDQGEPVGLREVQWPEEHGVHHREESGVEPYAQPQRDDHDEEHQGLGEERPGRVAEVLQEADGH